MSLKEDRSELHGILQRHDVQEFRKFVESHPEEYKSVSAEDVASDHYLFDLMHVYKALLPYMGDQYWESLAYCERKGLVELSPEFKMITKAFLERAKDASDCGREQDS